MNMKQRPAPSNNKDIVENESKQQGDSQPIDDSTFNELVVQNCQQWPSHYGPEGASDFE